MSGWRSIEVGDSVKTKGKVPMAEMGRSFISSLSVGRVNNIEGYRVHVAPGSLDGAGCWNAYRKTYVVDLRDLEKIAPPKREQ